MVGVTFQATFSTLKTITLPSRLIAVTLNPLISKVHCIQLPVFKVHASKIGLCQCLSLKKNKTNETGLFFFFGCCFTIDKVRFTPFLVCLMANKLSWGNLSPIRFSEYHQLSKSYLCFRRALVNLWPFVHNFWHLMVDWNKTENRTSIKAERGKRTK